MTTTPRPSVDELLDSLRIGDHLGLSRPWLRAVVGLLLLHVHAAVGSVRRTGGARQPEQQPAAIHLVVANPVRHGAVLAASAVGAARAHGVPLRVLADRRLADPGLSVDVGFPSVAVRSVVEAITAPGTEASPQLVNATNVYVLTDAGWRIAMHHASPPEQVAPPEEDEAALPHTLH